MKAAMRLKMQQSAMKARHHRSRSHQRTGRPLKQLQEPDVNRDQLRKRIAAHVLLSGGRSLAQVAVELGVNIEVLTQWNDKGRPLL